MVFKRRDRRGTRRIISDTIYPPGGWKRAVSYLWHRLRRLPDPPHRIARGIAVGMFVSFSPFFGFHFIMAAILSWIIRGNIAAAALTTFIGNPATFPFIAAATLSCGTWLMGRHELVRFHELSSDFGHATHDLWWNFRTLFNDQVPHWQGLAEFWHDIFLPYLLGGTVLGIIAGVASYALAHPVIDAYQRRRSRAIKQKLAARLAAAGAMPSK